MTTSASVNTSKSPFDFFNFVSATQPLQDADLIRQLPLISGLKETLMLRQVHALEHAMVWVLGELPSVSNIEGASKTCQVDNELLGGVSPEQGFYLYGQVNIASLQRAVRVAFASPMANGI